MCCLTYVVSLWLNFLISKLYYYNIFLFQNRWFCEEVAKNFTTFNFCTNVYHFSTNVNIHKNIVDVRFLRQIQYWVERWTKLIRACLYTSQSTILSKCSKLDALLTFLRRRVSAWMSSLCVKNSAISALQICTLSYDPNAKSLNLEILGPWVGQLILWGGRSKVTYSLTGLTRSVSCKLVWLSSSLSSRPANSLKHIYVIS